METLIIVREPIGPIPYWGSGETLTKARTNFKKVSKKFPTKRASIVAFKGSSEDIDLVQINDLGDINYPRSLKRIEIQ